MIPEEVQMIIDRLDKIEYKLNQFIKPESYRFNRPITALSGRAAAITSPTAPSATYQQAEAQSMKTAVDAIRTALTNLGVTL